MQNIVKLETVAVPPAKKRVAAYARVSGGKDAMLHSLAAQVDFYSGVIQKNTQWEYAGVYADEALTGTKDTRPEFQRLLKDCKDGKIDIILTKSLSRFARNTVTTLKTVRELRELGVDVWFEKENLHSLSLDVEFLISLYASFAQEESLSTSENQKWKIRKNFSEGISTATSMMGYRFENGSLVVIPEEAETVRMIFEDYLSGMGINAIVRKLRRLEIPTKHGGIWRENVVANMLSNEKYKGDMLLQKTFRSDHITKKKVKNEGQLPQYYVENSHEAIISPELFDAVQAERKRRSVQGKKGAKNTYPFTGKIVCEKCGKNYRRKTTAAGVRWNCSTYITYGKEFCDAKQIPEDILQSIVGERPLRQIRVLNDNTLKVIRSDGTESIHHWENRSRSESWTDEMRKKAKERSLQCRRNP